MNRIVIQSSSASVILIAILFLLNNDGRVSTITEASNGKLISFRNNNYRITISINASGNYFKSGELISLDEIVREYFNQPNSENRILRIRLHPEAPAAKINQILHAARTSEIHNIYFGCLVTEDNTQQRPNQAY